MSGHPETPAVNARQVSPRRLRRKALCLEAAVAGVLAASICTLLYVLSMGVAKAAGGL